MAPSDGGRLMAHDERRFAWQVGGALVLLGGWRLWRDAPGPPPSLIGTVLVTAGLALALTGALAPRWLAEPRRAWMALGNRMHQFMGPVITGLLYFVVVTPIGWLRRTFGRSPLARDGAASSFWETPHEGGPPVAPRHDKPY